MSVEALAKSAIEIQMTDIVDRVEADFKMVVGKYNKYSRTGEAVNSISVLERRPDYALIGGRNLHLYWLDEGNGGSGAIIYPKRSKSLYLQGLGVYRTSVKAHEAYHVAKQAADMHR